MTINSDQEEKKNPGVFTKIWNFLFDDFHQTAIVLATPLVIYGGYMFLPDEIVGIVKCPNPNCISNSNEPIETKFIVIQRDPLKIKCYYCEREPDMNKIDSLIM